MRRSIKQLEHNPAIARTSKEIAMASMQLALFHDNNGREPQAIPHYEKAISLGLDKKNKSIALAYLASSLDKSGFLQEALKRISESKRIADPTLYLFLERLTRRIHQKARFLTQ